MHYKRVMFSDYQAKYINTGKFWGLGEHLKAYTGIEDLKGFNGIGTWSQYIIVPIANVLKIDNEPRVSDAGLGSVFWTGLLSPSILFEVEEGSIVAVFGSNSLGLTLVYSLKNKNVSKIVVVGYENDKELFESLGVTYILDEGQAADIKTKLLEESDDGYDYTFEASNFNRFGSIALEVWHKGWGKCALLTRGANKDDTIKTKPFQLVTGRHWVGSYMGNVNISKHYEELLKSYKDHSEELGNLIFPTDNIVSIDDFPSKWEDLSKTASYHRTIIEF